MLTFVGSQLGGDDEKGGPDAGKAGISIRIYSQRLWVLTVTIEHAVMLMRIGIMRMSPEMPNWIADAKDTLEFRTMRMEEEVENLLAQGKMMNEIHTAMNEKHTRQVMHLISRLLCFETTCGVGLISTLAVARQAVAHKVGNKLKILKRMLPTVASGPDKMQMKIYRSHAEVKMKVDTRKEDDHGDDIEHQTRGKSSSVLYMETVGTALSAQVHSNGARDNSIDVDESSIQDL